ncbi:hypothetical protein D3C86_1637420 [compost metagenome]
MFTLEQINDAHCKVKSGAEFPYFMKAIKALGVMRYEAYIKDGHIDYYGLHDDIVKSDAKYASLEIANDVKKDQFKTELLAHQQGKTDFLSFIKMCAEVGVDKWIICMDTMTCTYYDQTGNEILVENIPV